MKHNALPLACLSVLATPTLALQSLTPDALPGATLLGSSDAVFSASQVGLAPARQSIHQRTAAAALRLAVQRGPQPGVLGTGGTHLIRAHDLDLAGADLPVGTSVQAENSGDIYIELNDVVLYQDSSDSTAQVLLNGNLLVNPLSISLCSSIDGSCDVTFRAEASSRAAAALEVSSNAAGSYDRNLEPLLIPVTSFTVGAFTVQPFLGFSFGVSGNVGANIVTRTVEQVRIQGGIELSGSGFAGIPSAPIVEAQFESPVFTQSTGADASVGVAVGVYFVVISAAGVPLGVPFVDGGAETQLAFQPTLDPWWDLDLHATLTAGYFTGELVPMFEQDLVDQTFDIADAGAPFDPLYDPAQARWSRAFDSEDSTEEATDVHYSNNGDLFVVGNLKGAVNQPWVAKLSGAGAVLWERTLDADQTGLRPIAVLESSNGDVFVAGNRLTTGKPYASRFDANGVELWTRAIDLPENLGTCYDALELPDGRVLLCGDALVGSDLIPAVIALEADGTLAWGRTLDVELSAAGSFRDAELLSNGDIAFAGNIEYTAEDGDTAFNAGVISILDNTGAHLRTRVVGRPAVIEGLSSLAEAPDGGLVAVGNVDGESYALWVVKLDAAGDLVWSRSHYGERVEAGSPAFTSDFDRSFELEAIDGGYLVVATTGIGADVDAQLFKLDEDGRPVWWKSFTGADVDRLNAIEVTPTNELIAAGTTLSVPNDDGETGAQDLWLLRASVDGMLRHQDESGLSCWNDRVFSVDTEAVDADAPAVVASPLSPTVSDLPETWTDSAVTSVLLSL